jgi:hypothetical protein
LRDLSATYGELSNCDMNNDGNSTYAFKVKAISKYPSCTAK